MESVGRLLRVVYLNGITVELTIKHVVERIATQSSLRAGYVACNKDVTCEICI